MNPVDINRALETTKTVARNEWKYVADVELDLDQDLPQVQAIGAELNQVFLNIVINAAHAICDVVGTSGSEKGSIRITTRTEGDHVVVAIADTGCGMPDDIRSKIFDPFFTTKEVGKGTGQGLTIAHRIVVERHGGTLAVESEPGLGSTFTIRLPIESMVEASATVQE